MEQNTIILIATISQLATTLILLGITGWYAYSTHLIVKEMQRQGDFIVLAAYAQVLGGIASLPSGVKPAAHYYTTESLEDLEGRLARFLHKHGYFKRFPSREV